MHAPTHAAAMHAQHPHPQYNHECVVYACVRIQIDVHLVHGNTATHLANSREVTQSSEHSAMAPAYPTSVRIDNAVQSLPEAQLSGQHRRMFNSIFMEMLASHERHLKKIRPMYIMLRMLLVGLPLLITIDIGMDESQTRIVVVAIMVMSAIRDSFSVDSRYISLLKVTHRLAMEGWSFVQLTGAYRDFDTQEEAYELFAERVAALHTGHTNRMIAGARGATHENVPRTASNVQGADMMPGAALSHQHSRARALLPSQPQSHAQQNPVPNTHDSHGSDIDAIVARS